MFEISSFFLILFSFFFFSFLGIGPTISLLTKQHRLYCAFLVTAVGSICFSFFSMFLSSLFNLSVSITNYLSFSLLFIWSVYALYLRKDEIKKYIKVWKTALIILTSMLCVVFFPTIMIGLDQNLGTVNLDFYQSLVFHEVLLNNNVPYWVLREDLKLGNIFLDMFPEAFQARFSSITLSIFLEQILQTDSRTSVNMMISTFLLSLPYSVFFFCKTVLNFKYKIASIAGLLITITAPTTMSFLYSFVGQNSALTAYPLCLALLFICSKNFHIKTMIFTCLILSGVFFIYVLSIKFIVPPFAIFMIYLLSQSTVKNIKKIISMILFMSFLVLAIQLSIYDITKQFLFDLLALLSRISQSKIFLGYLTEEVFYYAIGLTSQKLSNATYFPQYKYYVNIILFSLSILLVILYFYYLKTWSKKAPKNSKVLIFILLFTYISLWFYFTFITQYGYAPFKMSSWLQFMVVPFFSYGIYSSYIKLKSNQFNFLHQNLISLISYKLLFLYVLLNIFSCIDYGIKSFGKNIYNGSIINSYGVSGSTDLIQFGKDIKKFVNQEETVAIALSDSLETYWIAYYLHKNNIPASIISHQSIPLEDQFLPDVKSRIYLDSRGVYMLDEMKYFKDGKADFYLLPGENNLNKDIVLNKVSAKPIWKNRKYRLYKYEDLNNLIVTGRGFYRIENIDNKNKSWWWPKPFRWSMSGGEIYFIKPKDNKQEYIIEFSAINGPGYANGKRTIEIWNNEKLIDIITINGSGRFRTKKFLPSKFVNRLVLKIKEEAVVTPRPISLWNTHIPVRNFPINVLFSDIKIIKKNENLVSINKNKWINDRDIFQNHILKDGIDVNGWVRDIGTLVYYSNDEHQNIDLRIFIPGNLNFYFPFTIDFHINDEIITKEFKRPGLKNISLNFKNPYQLNHIKIKPSSYEILSKGKHDRQTMQSVQLKGFKIY